MRWCVSFPRSVYGVRHEEGSSLVEFALTFIVIMGLLFGAMQLCLAFYTYQVVNEYARAGARYAMVHGSNCFLADGTTSCQAGNGSNPTIQAVVRGYGYPGINSSTLTVTPTYYQPLGTTSCATTACTGTGGQVKVTVSYPFKLSIPFIPSKSMTMSSSSTMIISQ